MIWRMQRALDSPAPFTGSRDATARDRMERQTEWYGAHRDDQVLDS